MNIRSLTTRIASHALIGVAAMVIVGTQLGNGCSSDGGGGGYESSGGGYPSGGGYDGGGYGGGNNYPGGGYPGGSSSDYGSDGLPRNAKLVSEGVGTLGFRANSTGRMYLYDVKRRNVLYSFDLVDGDDVRVSPDDNRVYVNGRSVSKVDLPSDRVHRLYFDGRRTSGGSYGNTGNSGGYDRPNNSGNSPYGRPDNKPPVKRPVPDSAKLVADGPHGADVSYKAAANGRVYLYDNTSNVLVNTFNVKRNQRLTVSPANDLATLDGKTVMQRSGLSKRANYRLLFDAE